MMVAFCVAPALAVIVAGAPEVFVRLNVAGVPIPAAVAVTLYDPATRLAVKTGAVAIPNESVTAVFTPPAKVPLAPEFGAVKVTVTFRIGLLEASLTRARRFAANEVPTCALCEFPPTAVITAAGPGVLVRLKIAGVVTPGAEALI